MKKLYIFDFDGTIADTKSVVKQGLIDFSNENNLSIPDVEAICYGYANPDNYDFKWGVDKKTQKELMDKAFIQTSIRISNGIYIPELFPHTVEIMDYLFSQGNDLAVCTSREKGATIDILERNHLSKYFKTYRTREDVTVRGKKAKPNPELILEIIDELGYEKQDCFMIGDTDGDIKGAENASIESIGVSWGYFTKQQLKDCGCKNIIDDFLELKDF